MASYIIVGAGVFGVSTAYHLIKKYPNASITIVDRDAYDADSQVAASWDWNKVVRADYDDILYCRLGIEAQRTGLNTRKALVHVSVSVFASFTLVGLHMHWQEYAALLSDVV